MKMHVALAVTAGGLGAILALINQTVDARPLALVAGTLVLIGLGAALWPWLKRLAPPPLQGLFPAIPRGHRWCDKCGQPRKGPCTCQAQ